jgi:hypothetical protein
MSEDAARDVLDQTAAPLTAAEVRLVDTSSGDVPTDWMDDEQPDANGASEEEPPVGTFNHCPPLRSHAFEPSFIELNSIL